MYPRDAPVFWTRLQWCFAPKKKKRRPEQTINQSINQNPSIHHPSIAPIKFLNQSTHQLINHYENYLHHHHHHHHTAIIPIIPTSQLRHHHQSPCGQPPTQQKNRHNSTNQRINQSINQKQSTNRSTNHPTKPNQHTTNKLSFLSVSKPGNTIICYLTVVYRESGTEKTHINSIPILTETNRITDQHIFVMLTKNTRLALLSEGGLAGGRGEGALKAENR